MTLYSSPLIRMHFVIRDEDGAWWVVPAINGGWSHRQMYRGSRTNLDPVPLTLNQLGLS